MTSLDLTGANIDDEAISTIVANSPNVGELVLRKTAVTNAALGELPT